ncbi:MAG: hypothetical protein JWO80_6028 [Bryobacterales bacterium]|nr:hypothetical protein [Bryobacterales bacterium]
MNASRCRDHLPDRELKNFAPPICPRSSSCHVTGDRVEHRSDDFRLETRNFSSKGLLAVPTHRPAQGKVEMIDGLMTQVSQVAAPRTKRGKEILIVHLGVPVWKAIRIA